MSTRNPRDASKERFWRRMVRLWSHSDLTIRAFCQLHDLSEPSFYAWRRILERRAAEQAAFVPVQVVAERPAVSANALELVLTDGRTVRVAPGFDAATLRQLLAVLQEGGPC